MWRGLERGLRACVRGGGRCEEVGEREVGMRTSEAGVKKLERKGRGEKRDGSSRATPVSVIRTRLARYSRKLLAQIMLLRKSFRGCDRATG